ncbi:glycosyltransferase [Nonomuraea sp. NPDC050663]|uniref:glycosyltransferase n=1 Tax=Nonomuraea sp. NPDC050663 TaxID=3364370 RepID=UPI0037B60AFD
MRVALRREHVLFAFVGLSVAVLGHLLLALFIRQGLQPAVANVLQFAITLQVSFAANYALTWHPRVSGSDVGLGTRWRRYQLARGASAVLNAVAFPFLAPAVGTGAAYWGLVVACAVVNFCSDKYWSFSPRRTTLAHPRVLLGALATVLLVLASAIFADYFLIGVSLFMLLVSGTTVTFQLYKWWWPEHNDPHRYGDPGEPRLPGVILVPMRFEEAVAGHTLERLANLDHPDYTVVAIVDHADDPGTAAIAHAKAREHPGRILVCAYPEDTEVHNKPTALNAAMRMLEGHDVRFEWVGVADAEDLFHPGLLRMVDHRFRASGAGIVQCGVQLMNFGCALHAVAGRGWWHAHTSAWWRAANCLEYFKWFQSRLKMQARIGVMPLGGNTVFFRRQLLEDLRERYGSYWDEDCLTEDCKIGIAASVLRYPVDVVYVDEMVTREETPESLRALVRQRVRWMQGFIQVFLTGEWLRLPTRTQRVLAVYVLGFQFFQAFVAVLAPVALLLALLHKAPEAITLLATLPLALTLLNSLLDIQLLAQFGRTFGERVRLRDYVGLVLGAWPYQLALSYAALWAMIRHLRRRTDWVKTTHQGAHLDTDRVLVTR